MPVITLYGIPNRDCGGYSQGGASSETEYRGWIKEVKKGFGKFPVVVIFEPDALAATECLSPQDLNSRLSLIADSVKELKTDTNSVVYIDAGNSHWIKSPEMTKRLTKAGVDRADGFALNVSNYQNTGDSISFGQEVSKGIHNKHFVIDTSRNGRGPDPTNNWCNPFGRGLGAAPTINPGPKSVDAYLWIKNPGTSDGSCGGGPKAGKWWDQIARDLIAQTSI